MKKPAPVSRKRNVTLIVSACGVTMALLGFVSHSIVFDGSSTAHQQSEAALLLKQRVDEFQRKKDASNAQGEADAELIVREMNIDAIAKAAGTKKARDGPDAERSESKSASGEKDSQDGSAGQGNGKAADGNTDKKKDIAPIVLEEPLLPGQCLHDPDLDDPLVKAIEVPKTNKDYLKIKKGGFGYPDFMFQCRERRFGNFLQFAAEQGNDPDNTILDPSGRYHWCPSKAASASDAAAHADYESRVAPNVNPLTTPAIPAMLEGVPTGAAAHHARTDPATVTALQKDRSFETLIPLLKMSLRRRQYLEPIFQVQRTTIDAPTPNTHVMWSEGSDINEEELGSSILLDTWNERFGSTPLPSPSGSDNAPAIFHEERLKRIIVVTTWLLNRPAELNRHILKMIEKSGQSVSDTTLNNYWYKVQKFQLAALNITGRFRDETFFQQ